MTLQGERPRIAVLLGAGASRQAGLPLSSELTHQVAALLAAEAPPVFHHTFQQLLTAIANHNERFQPTIFEMPNIERVVSSMRALTSRHSHELAPFVESWNPVVAELDRAYRLSFSRDEAARGHDESDTGELFHALESLVLSGVVHLLNKATETQYLAPLVQLSKTQPHGLDVATLNYDLTIEDECARSSAQVSRGADRDWAPGSTLSFADDGLRLYKLHGSIDWILQETALPPRKRAFDHELYAAGDRKPSTKFVVRDDPSSTWTRCLNEVQHGRTTGIRSPRPAVVLGDREKLSADGAMIALLRDFSLALKHCERLVVVGYSFADSHINRIIENWLSIGRRRHISVVDPYWPRGSATPQGRTSETRFDRAAWASALTRPQGTMMGGEYFPDPPRLCVFRLSTPNGLPAAIENSAPEIWQDDIKGTISCSWSAQSVDLAISLSPPRGGLYAIEWQVRNLTPDAHQALLSVAYDRGCPQPLDDGEAALKVRRLELSARIDGLGQSPNASLVQIAVYGQAETAVGPVHAEIRFHRNGEQNASFSMTHERDVMDNRGIGQQW